MLTDSFSWVPSLGIELSFVFDGLSIFYGLVITTVGTLVCWYGASYFAAGKKSMGWFYSCLLLFMSAMLGTVFSGNLLTMFIFWELTGVASFLLIGFANENKDGRNGARRALLVTFATGLCMLAGLILLGQQAGTYELKELAAAGDSALIGAGVLAPVMMVLLLLGAFGKSAQFPFHFWLPGAMAAPTPVSAYLHSATMVKLGVFLTARLYPMFHTQDLWLPIVGTVGFFTMLVGAFLALRSHDLKEILAFSTVSQLGFLIAYYGVGSKNGVQFDLFHVVSHVFYKGSLFMVVGVIDHAAGTRDLRRLGGLRRRMPWMAVAALIGCASLSGVPFTTGFISKELMLAELTKLMNGYSSLGILFLTMVVISAIMTVAFAIRMYLRTFTGKVVEIEHFHTPSLSVQIPPLLLAGAGLFFGCFPALIGDSLNLLHVPGLHTGQASHLALWHGFNRELLISFLIFVLGFGLYRILLRWNWDKLRIPKLFRFDTYFDHSIELLYSISRKFTLALRADWPPAYLPIVIFTFLSIVGTAFIIHFKELTGWRNVPITVDPVRAFVALSIALSMGAVLMVRRWTSQMVALSIGGFFITYYFVLYRAPDLAMTQILVESATLVMMLALAARFSTGSRAGTRFEFKWNKRQVLRAVLALGMGGISTVLVLFADLNRHSDPVGLKMMSLSYSEAHGTNAVNTILVDFRAFDTMGEITVLLTAALACVGLMMRYRRVKPAGKRSAFAAPGFLMGGKKND